MMRVIKKIVGAVAITALLLVFTGVGGYFVLYDNYNDFKSDIDTVTRRAKLELFNRGYNVKITADDVRYIY